MANQFHRLQTQAELHRPERTGRGNPNLLTKFVSESEFTIPDGVTATKDNFIFNPEDGQYYQDLVTGDVYRFNKFSTLDTVSGATGFIGNVNVARRDEGQQNSTIILSNSSVTEENPLSLTDGRELLLQDSTGESQVIIVSGDQSFTTEDFTIRVRPFVHKFNLGTFYNTTAYITKFRVGGIWERLIGYDRDSESITNAISTAKSQAIGEITVEFGGTTINEYEEGGGQFWTNILTGNIFDNEADAIAEASSSMSSDPFGIPSFGNIFVRSFFVDPVITTKKIPREVTDITANLFVELTEGEEITVFNQRTAESIKLTINNNGDDVITTFGPGENIVLDVQDDRTKSFFPAGSLIFGEEGFKESSIKVDPSRIQLAVLGARGGDGIGVLTQDVGVGTTTQLSLNRIDDTVTLKDNQALILTNKFGDVKQFTVDGDQVLSVGSDTLNVNNIVIAAGEPIFEAGTATVKEPSYSTSSRITVQEGSITSAVNLATDAVNATSAIEQRVSSTEASITQSVQFNEVSGQVRLVAGPGGSEFTVQADQVRIDGTTTFASGFDPSTKETPAGAQSKANAAQSAAQAYAQNLVDSLDLSAEDLTARNELSQLLGYADFADAVAATNATQTVIDGGFINTALINVDNLMAQNIAFAGSLIGDNILVRETASPSTTVFEAGDGALKIFPSGVIQGLNQPQFTSPTKISMVLGVDEEASDNNTVLIRFDNNVVEEEFGLEEDNNFHMSTGLDVRGNTDIIGDLDVSGDIECTTLTETSDKYQKENIEDIGPTLDKIVQLSGKRYDMLGPSTTKNLGLLAQDVEPLFPEAVRMGGGENEEGERIEYKTLSYTQLIPVLIESIKELKQQNEELKTRIEGLEQQS